MVGLCLEGLEELRKAVLWDNLARRDDWRHFELSILRIPVVAGAIEGRFSVV